MKRTRIAVILCLLAVLYACDNTSQNDVLNGVLEVPENRRDSNSRTLKLVYKVLKAKKADPSKAPIVYLQGGSGVATVMIMEEFWANHPLRKDRDIVLLDQRGTGASGAYCIHFGESLFSIRAEDYNAVQAYGAMATLLAACKKEIQQKGIDLEGYNSREDAADFEDLRKALGYKKWNLYGGSYGTRLGLTIMRDFPESVRSAILSAVFPPDFNSFVDHVRTIEISLLMVFQKCGENPACNSRYPNLKERLQKVLTKMQTEPLRLAYKGKPYVLNSHEAFELIVQSLYDRYLIGNIPNLIEALENGEPQPIIEVMKTWEPVSDVMNFPTNFSVSAYEVLPLYNESDFEMAINQSEFGYARAFYELDIKLRADWHSYRASTTEFQPVVSDIPTLLLSGELDPVAPPGNATEALKYLRNGYEVIFSNESHGLLSNPCFTKMTEDFVNNPFQKPNINCSSETGPIEWNLSKLAQ